MNLSIKLRSRRAPLVVAVCVAILSFALLTASAGADANDNHAQNPVAGDPVCLDLFPPDTLQQRNDPPVTAYQPPVYFTYSDSGHHVQVSIDPGYTLIGVIVHGGASGSNVYQYGGVWGRMIATRNPGGGLDQIHYTIACYTQDPPPTTTVPVQTQETTTTTTTTTTTVAAAPSFDIIPTSTTTTAPPPPIVLTEVAVSAPAQPIVGQPAFTG